MRLSFPFPPFLRSLILTRIVMCCTTTIALAGGIKGTITDENDEPLAFATIFVKQTGSGTTTNVQGVYELPLRTGEYDISFQYIGYETVTQKVEITSEFTVIIIVLKQQATLLQSVEVRGGKEDPAYTILR